MYQTKIHYMKIIVDEREITLYDKMNAIISENANPANRLFKTVLILGDIAIHDDNDTLICLLERKSLSDLLASIKDGRYEEQSHRLLHASQVHPHNIIYIIEGMMSQLRSAAEKKMVYSAITSLNLYKGFSVLRTCSIQETAEIILGISDKISRNFSKNIHLANSLIQNTTIQPEVTTDTPSVTIENAVSNYVNFVKKVKKDNITPENIGEIILSQIPGISSVTALAIMKTYGTFPKLMEELCKNADCLDGTMCESVGGKSRKISKTCIENIKKYLLDK